MTGHELLQPQDITKDALRKIFEDAFLFHEIDSDGDVVIKDTFRAFVVPMQEGGVIRIFCVFGAKPGATDAAKLRFVNEVNGKLLFPRAMVKPSGRFEFEQVVVVAGGISRRNLVMAAKKLLSSISGAAKLDTDDVMA